MLNVTRGRGIPIIIFIPLAMPSVLLKIYLLAWLDKKVFICYKISCSHFKRTVKCATDIFAFV